jgi:hypothetical protein
VTSEISLKHWSYTWVILIASSQNNILDINENNFSPRVLYPLKLSFKIDRAIKIFHDKQKLKWYMTVKPPLKEILKGILHTEEESKQKQERMGSIKPQGKKRQEISE